MKNNDKVAVGIVAGVVAAVYAPIVKMIVKDRQDRRNRLENCCKGVDDNFGVTLRMMNQMKDLNRDFMKGI